MEIEQCLKRNQEEKGAMSQEEFVRCSCFDMRLGMVYYYAF
jgi:hypothetical protein